MTGHSGSIVPDCVGSRACNTSHQVAQHPSAQFRAELFSPPRPHLIGTWSLVLRSSRKDAFKPLNPFNHERHSFKKDALRAPSHAH